MTELDLDILNYLSPEERAELDALTAVELNAEAVAGIDNDPAGWIEANFYIPELAGPLRLAEYQRRMLTEALSRDDQGNFKYSLILWSDIKKSAKSSIAAAVALWRAHCVAYGQIQIVANDKRQADSRVGYYLRRAISLNPTMRDTIKVTPSGYKVELPNHTIIEALAIDPSGEAGGNPDMVVYSELWGATTEAHEKMWTETTLSPTKFGKSFRWVESYAGISGESKLLEQLYDQTVVRGRQLWADLPVYVNDAARMIALWNTTPRLPWQTPEYYSQERSQLSPPEFMRVHENQWVTSVNKFVDQSWLDACYGEVKPLDRYTPCVVGIDAGVSSDNFAMCGVSVDYKIISVPGSPVVTRRIIVHRPELTYLWQPAPGAKLLYSDPPGGPLDPAQPAPRTVIERLAAKYHVVEWCYDPYQLHNLCTELYQNGVGYFVEIAQSSGGKRAKADKNLQDIIKSGAFLHNNHPELVEHLKNAGVKKEGDGLRLQKTSNIKKIDLVVALSMACYELDNLNL